MIKSLKVKKLTKPTPIKSFKTMQPWIDVLQFNTKLNSASLILIKKNPNTLASIS